MALPDDLSPGRDPGGEHPCRYCAHGYHLLVRSHGLREASTYKTAWHGGTLIVADRWFASSKTCSECGAVKTKLALSERQWACMSCGTVLDRDVNAAVNLARRRQDAGC
jgi:hypothetical protein